jgi:hypothetical protein
MVARAQGPGMDDRPRLMRIFAEVEMPGSVEDHRWLAERLSKCRRRLPQNRETLDMTGLLAAGLLTDWGLDMSRTRELEGRCFPDAWLRAVPALLRLGFPTASWVLVEGGILHFDGPGRSGKPRWRLQTAALRQVEAEWYELGAAIGIQTLMRGLTPLLTDAELPVQIAFSGCNRAEGRKWLRRLRGELRALELDHAAHLLVS